MPILGWSSVPTDLKLLHRPCDGCTEAFDNAEMDTLIEFQREINMAKESQLCKAAGYLITCSFPCLRCNIFSVYLIAHSRSPSSRP